LIAEDDENLAMIFAQALEQAGLVTSVARTGDDVLTKLATNTPRVIVLDLHLPNVSGISILKFIRGNSRLNRACVMIASADAALAEEYRDMVDLVLVNPISFVQLRDLATRFL
jgi:DNA-binding response OmpR family regulator